MENNLLEMRDLKRKNYGKSTWIPLREVKCIENGNWGYIGYEEEYLGIICVMFDVNYMEAALNMEWTNISSGHNRPFIDGDIYHEAGTFTLDNSGKKAYYLVLEQELGPGEVKWHLKQDIILALNLVYKNDVWYSPEEDDLEVVRLKRDQNGEPSLIEIRAEHLRDYLCARGSGAVIFRYHSRKKIAVNFNSLNWENGKKNEKTENLFWEGRFLNIMEGGLPNGKIAAFRAYRKNIEDEDDIPGIDISDDANIGTESWSTKGIGKKLILAFGELWKNDWIKPGKLSPRTRHDYMESTIPFIVDNDGSTIYGDALKSGIRWLWFKPTVVNAILSKPKSILNWYTEDTGSIGVNSDYSVHFGMNDLGLINVFGKDIGMLPIHHQRIWVAHNITPEGRVSLELLKSQMECNPASSKAPEIIFYENLEQFEKAFQEKFGEKIFREHYLQNEILKRVNRFHSTNKDELFSLAKEICRLIIDRINIDILKNLRPTEDKKIRSLKRLERLVAEVESNSREIMGPLAGINELRNADAHLPANDFTEELKLVRITEDKIFPIMGEQMIKSAAEALSNISKVLRKIPS